MLLDGQEPNGVPPAGTVLVFQNYAMSVFPWRTVVSNIVFGLRSKTGESSGGRQERAMRYARLVGLERYADYLPGALSGGMIQRVAIARALAHEPTILLMDEPFSSLDAMTRAELQDLLLRLWEQFGFTVVFITHDIGEAIYLADRVAWLTPPPATVGSEVEVLLPRPRHQLDTREEPRFLELVRVLTSAVGRAPWT